MSEQNKMFKWDKRRGLCMKMGGRYYALAAYGEGYGEDIADVLNREYPKHENAKLKKLYKSLGLKWKGGAA